MGLRSFKWQWRRQRVVARIALRFAHALISVLVASMIGGCASIERQDVRLADAKSIGIVAAIGDEFTLTRAGLTTPGESEQHFSIAAWGLDDLIAIRMGVLLGKRYKVQGLAYSRAAFAEREAASAFTVSKMLSARERDSRIVDLVRTGVAPQGLDVYVVVTRAESSYGSRGLSASGIGAIDRVALLGSSGQLHALFAITVIDGHTFKVIGRRQAGPIEGGDDLYRLRGPSRQISAELMSAAQDPAGSYELKAVAIDLIDRGLGRTLQELQLIDQSRP